MHFQQASSESEHRETDPTASRTSKRAGLKAICLTAWNRPQELAQLLASLQRLRGLADWSLYVCVEPSQEQNKIIDLITAASLPCKLNLNRNCSQQGVRGNPLSCLQEAADDGAETFLLLEDDLEVSADCLEFIEQATAQPSWDRQYRCGNLHFSTCFNSAHLNHWDKTASFLTSTAFDTYFLSSLGLFFSRTQFESFIQPHWWDAPLLLRDFFGERISGWDCALKQALLLGNQPCLQSLLPRVRHLGVVGVHSDAVLHQRSYAHAGLYSGQQPLTDLAIHTVEGINANPPDGCEHWGHLLRMAHQLWTLERTALKRQLELARCSRDLRQYLEPLRKPRS